MAQGDIAMSFIIIISYLIAHVFWFFLFSPVSRGLNFWLVMAIANGALTAVALVSQRRSLNSLFKFRISRIFIGIISAGVLYFVFFLGKEIIGLLLPFSKAEVVRIYNIKQGTPALVIGILLFAWIGPCEEIFWRGFLQQRLASLFGKNSGYIAAAFMYGITHLYALNFTLFGAALVCALFWGFLFKRYGSLWPAIISHSVWDVFVFIIAPIQ